MRKLRLRRFSIHPLVYIIGGFCGALGALFYAIASEEDAGLKLAEETSMKIEDGTQYHLHSAHAVREQQGKDNFIYNFDNKTVSFSSDFINAGGLMPFSALDEQEDIEDAREKGCAIATDLIPGLTDYANLFKGAEHDEAINNARAFIKNYCP